jgi:hypothetical protein
MGFIRPEDVQRLLCGMVSFKALWSEFILKPFPTADHRTGRRLYEFNPSGGSWKKRVHELVHRA